MYRRVSSARGAAKLWKQLVAAGALCIGLAAPAAATDAVLFDAELLAPKNTETPYFWSDPNPYIDPPETSQSQTAKNVRVANYATGRFVSAYHTGDPNDLGTTPAQSQVYVTYSDTNGNSWQDPFRIPPIPGVETAYEFRPEVQSNGVGTYVMIYDAFVDQTQKLYTVQSDDDGETWGTPREVAMSSGLTRPRAASIDTDTSGTWMAAFIAQDNLTTSVVLAKSEDSGANWEIMHSEPAHGGRPQIKTSFLDGLTVVVFEKPGAVNRDIGYLVTPDYGEEIFSGVLNSDALTDTRNDYAPRLDFNSEGNRWVAIWGGRSTANSASSVWSAYADFEEYNETDGGLAWSSPLQVNTGATDFGSNLTVDPWVATDHKGNWVAAWSSQNNIVPGVPRDIYHVTSYNDGTTWTVQSSINSDFYNDNTVRWERPVLASNRIGHWLAAWTNRPAPIGQPEGLQTAVPWYATTFISTGEGDFADLVITGQVIDNPVYQTVDFRVRYTVTNNGPLDVENVTVQIDPPTPPIEVIDVTGPPEWLLATPVPGPNAQGIITSLEAGKSVVLIATFNSSNTGTYYIESFAYAPPGTIDPFEANNLGVRTRVDIETAPVIADLRVTKIAYPNDETEEQVEVDKYLGYTITVRNLSPQTAPNVVLVDPIPAGVNFNYAATSQGTWATTSSGGRTTVTAFLGSIPGGARATVAIATTPRHGFSVATNRACASHSGVDLDPSNNCGEVTVHWEGGVGTDADVSILKTASSVTVDQGSSFTYTLRARNNGPAAATGVFINDDLPDEVEFRSFTNSPNVTVTRNGSLITGDVGNLASEEEAVVNIAVTAMVPETVYNTATVTATSPDSNPDNNSSTRSVFVEPIDPDSIAELHVTKSASPSPGTVGVPLIYTLNVGNQGPADAINLVLEDLLPDEMAYEDTVVITPEHGTETSYLNGRVTYTIPNLPAGTTATLNIEVMPIVDGEITNTASAFSDAPDINTSNNSASVTTTIFGGVAPQTNADLATTATVSPTSGSAGNALVLTLRAGNHGPQSANEVTVRHNLNTTTTLMDVTAPNGNNYFIEGSDVVVPIGLLGPGQVRTITITLIPQFNGPLILDSRISGHVNDPDLSNNEASVFIQVGEGVSDLQGIWLKITHKAKKKGTVFNVKGVLAVRNDRTVRVPFVSVYFYLSNDDQWDRNDDVLFAAHLYKKIKPGKMKKKAVKLKPATDPTAKYIIAVIDRDGVSENIVPIEIPPAP